MAGQAPIGKWEKSEPDWHSRGALREDLSLGVKGGATQQSRPARRNHVREWVWSYGASIADKKDWWPNWMSKSKPTG